MGVTWWLEGSVALVEIDNPPVNAASHAVRAGLMRALDEIEHSGAEAVALFGAGRGFVAGADIREFGQPPKEPHLPDVVTRIDTYPKPVICVIHGTALGGGLEIAMAAQRRVAMPGARIGLPEVGLGLIPGAGGTQFAPRLAGLARAIDLITSGKPVPASDALDMGLVDEIATGGSPQEAALAAAEAVIAGRATVRRTGTLTCAPDTGAIAASRARFEAAVPRLEAPLRAIEALEAASGTLADGLKTERALFLACRDSAQHEALRHAFFAERAVSKVPEAASAPRALSRVGVVGAGTMGSGIATACLLAGLETVLIDQNEDAVQRGRDTIAGNLSGAVRRGKLSETARDDLLSGRLHSATTMEALAECDLVIEAVFEDMEVKTAIFARLDAVCKPGAVLATNTSYLDVTAIAAATARPADVIGLHFFSPAHIMRLVEVIVPDDAASDAVATGFAFARKLRKVAVRSGVCDGFIGNRMLMHYRRAADYMVLDGAMPDQIDRALEAWGFAMGPFRVADLAGLDINWAQRKRLAPTRPAEERYSPVADHICEAGCFGRKTGRGYYVYEGGSGQDLAPEVSTIIDTVRQEQGITPRSFTDQEIVTRYLTAMIVEAARIVGEGIALRPSDVDAVLLFGYGFPRHRGGPLHHADVLGPDRVAATIRDLAAEDPYFWKIPPLLADLAASGRRFSDLA